jgi:hypothetical protein
MKSGTWLPELGLAGVAPDLAGARKSGGHQGVCWRDGDSWTPEKLHLGDEEASGPFPRAARTLGWPIGEAPGRRKPTGRLLRRSSGAAQAVVRRLWWGSNGVRRRTSGPAASFLARRGASGAWLDH